MRCATDLDSPAARGQSCRGPPTLPVIEKRIMSNPLAAKLNARPTADKMRFGAGSGRLTPFSTNHFSVSAGMSNRVQNGAITAARRGAYTGRPRRSFTLRTMAVRCQGPLGYFSMEWASWMSITKPGDAVWLFSELLPFPLPLPSTATSSALLLGPPFISR